MFGKRLTARDGMLYEYFGGGDTWAGESVTAKGALNLSAFWAGTRITAETVASLSLDVMEKRSDGVKVRVSDHPLQYILDESPNADQTAIEFWEERILGLCTTGNAFAEKVYRSGGNLVSLNPMPADTAVSRSDSGALQYRFQDRGKEIVLPAEKVFHLKAFGEGDVGFSPVEYARQTLSLTIATEKMAGQSYSKGLRSKGFFVMPPGQKLSEEARASAKRSLVDANSGPNAPWAMVLEGGVDFKPISISMRDAEMILNRRFNVEDVCRWLGIPPILVGHAAEGQTMWGTGVSAIMQNWLNLSLRNRLKRVEQAIAKRIMTPEERRRFSVKFNYEDLLRSDTKARYEAHEIAIRAGFKTINQVRRLEGDAPVDGGDVVRTQMQNVPIDQADASAQENNQ